MKSIIILGTLTIALAYGAIRVADSRFHARQLMSEIQAAKTERDTMRLEWTQLILEESTLTDEAIIYQVAENQLNMALPTTQVVVYRQP